jgi:hypothetical protein
MFFGWQRGWYIISFPSSLSEKKLYDETATAKKKGTLFFFKDDRWYKEEIELLINEHKEYALMYLINSWLSYLEEETLTKKQTSVQTAILNRSKTELFISFDRNPFNKEDSITEKLMWVESLLKTIRTFDTTVNEVRFLVHHEPLSDVHIDFSKSWPICGFVR